MLGPGSAALLLPVQAVLLSTAAALPARQEAVTILALGDSTTALRGSVRSHTQELENLLEAYGVEVLVINAAQPKATTTEARERFEAELRAHDPDLVLMQFGIFDSMLDGEDATARPRVPLEEFERNITYFVATLEARGTHLILITSNPVFWTTALRERWKDTPLDTGDPMGADAFNRQYAEAVRAIAEERGVPLVDVHRSYMKQVALRERPEELLTDGIHPGTQAQERLGERLATRVLELADTGRLAPRPIPQPDLDGCERVQCVAAGVLLDGGDRMQSWKAKGRFLEGTGHAHALLAGHALLEGDFRIRAKLALEKLDGTQAGFVLNDSIFGFDGRGQRMFAAGPMFGPRPIILEHAKRWMVPGEAFELVIERAGAQVRISINGARVYTFAYSGPFEETGFEPAGATLWVLDFELAGKLRALAPPVQRGYSIPVVDLASEGARQVVVDREPGQYLGHPTTVLLEDGKTMLATYPKGHGAGAIVMKRSEDGGLTWSERLPLPENWATSREVPTIHRVVDPDGVARLILFSGMFPIRLAVSEDDGRQWTPLTRIGKFGGIVAMSSVERLASGDYMALFHDDGRFIRGRGGEGASFKVYRTLSQDGGLTWSGPRIIAAHPEARLCEPGAVRSPDGRQIALLLRENSRLFNSFVIFSDDEGETWSEPRELPGALTGDRHVGRYAEDGRLVLTFRDTTLESSTKGDWVAWVGTYDDIRLGREGQYRVRLMDNHKAADCGYPGLERLPDDTFVATSYGHWIEGAEPFVVSVRFRLDELDARASRSVDDVSGEDGD